jgi:hypothetical protein
MQVARFVGKLGLLFSLVLAGFAVGCGSEQRSTPVSNEEGKIIKEQRKQDHQRSKEANKPG